MGTVIDINSFCEKYRVAEASGGSTHGYLKSKPNRRMEEINAKKIIGQLLSALSYLHSKCISHRDIKLENVMLDNYRNVKLIDFGFSTQIPNT